MKQQSKEPLQLDLFTPHAYGYEFKVILTNNSLSHNGRAQPGETFADLDYVPTRTWVGNQIYRCSSPTTSLASYR